jgi:zinc/manganese transport system ATP-binding protein
MLSAPRSAEPGGPAVVELRGARLSFGPRTLWSGLDLTVEPGQFITVLGSNGSGKSSLLKSILGTQPLSAGTVSVSGLPTRRGSRQIGYIPQHSGYSVDVPLRGRDLVRLGLDGTQWGPPLPWRARAVRRRVDELIERVGAGSFADRPLGRLSGGEQQQLRAAQALATDPAVLLCDEPLLSLDLRHQRHVVDLLDKQRRDHGTAVLFVTHEINPVLPVTDLVLYLNDGRFRIGTPDEVMTSEVLTGLYRSPVEVIRRGDQIVVLGADDSSQAHPHSTAEVSA